MRTASLHAALPVCRYPTAMHAQQHSAFCQTSFFRVSKRAGENNREIWGLTVWEELETILKAGAYTDHAAEQVSNKCIAVRKVATPLRELTCHMGSHSVTCHPAGTRLQRPRRTHVECSQLNTYKWCIQNKEVTETTSTSSARLTAAWSVAISRLRTCSDCTTQRAALHGRHHVLVLAAE